MSPLLPQGSKTAIVIPFSLPVINLGTCRRHSLGQYLWEKVCWNVLENNLLPTVRDKGNKTVRLPLSLSPSFPLSLSPLPGIIVLLNQQIAYSPVLLFLGFPGGTSGKEPFCQCRKHKRGFDPWVGKIPWRRAWQSTPVFLPGESHGQSTLAGYSP